MGNSASHTINREEPRMRVITIERHQHQTTVSGTINSSELITMKGPDNRDEEEANWEAAAKISGETCVCTRMLIVAAISGKGFLHLSSSRYLKRSLDGCLPLLTLAFAFSKMIWMMATEKNVPGAARSGRTARILHAAASFTYVVSVIIVVVIAVDAMTVFI